MTQEKASYDLAGKQFPPHSEACFIWPGEQCRACNDLLGPYPPSQWREVYRQHQAKAYGVLRLLPARFVDRLIDTILHEPEKWAPLVQFLQSYERKEP